MENLKTRATLDSFNICGRIGTGRTSATYMGIHNVKN